MKRGIRYPTKEFAATLSMDGSPRRQNRPLTPRNSWAQDNMPSTNSKASPDGKQLSSLQWKNQVDRSRMEENHIANTQNSKKQTGLAKVSKPLMKLLKDAEGDKMIARGKRVPFGNVSSNTMNSSINLKKKGETKRQLDKIQSRLPELC
jgi:hypothetical protein